MTRSMPAELAEILDEIAPPGRGFGHRQHVHLAFIAARRYGTARAADMISDWIRQLTAHAPQKFNATVTRAWTEIVGHHVAADPAATDFDAFAERYPALLNKRLLTRHYSAAVLASPQARTGWVEPDLAPFGWRPGPSAPDGR
ncbi:MAG TPA: hypothetical protein VMC83_35030 [Streptosporangiaceae bacterium]|nr:hypothetical protein [Streptosporangiaceae bacterium]